MINNLNLEQKDAVLEDGNVLIKACPGSGKTRVLTIKLVREIEKIANSKKYICAVTYTNRAAEEIKRRIDKMNVDTGKLWAGTIHTFCLEWILRPYSGYCDRIKNGFVLADEYLSKKILAKIKKDMGIGEFDEVKTAVTRLGKIEQNLIPIRKKAAKTYHKELINQKLIDFDLVLFLSYKLLVSNLQIAKNISSLIPLICVDEYQDTQDMQYGILGEIIKSSCGESRIFMVGDPDQSIFSSLGGIAKTKEQIEQEMEIEIKELSLNGNYRSSQRIIDYYSTFQTTPTEIQALGANAGEHGIITFKNQTISKDDLHTEIANLIQLSLNSGIPQNEICVIAPRWEIITKLARDLKKLLPKVYFDAPVYNPFRTSKENIWFKIARLFLTDPSPHLYLTRIRWANEVIKELEHFVKMVEEHKNPLSLLRTVNAIYFEEKDGLKYLELALDSLMNKLRIDYKSCRDLFKLWETFFESAQKAFGHEDFDVPNDIKSLKNLFKETQGVVINTCHGTKGEEYQTVIAFALLWGYIPHWNTIRNYHHSVQTLQSNRLLYVICSRAKTNLHLLAENGRTTTKRNPYETNRQLNRVKYKYDDL